MKQEIPQIRRSLTRLERGLLSGLLPETPGILSPDSAMQDRSNRPFRFHRAGNPKHPSIVSQAPPT